ncbi:hypothetical protein [Prosthecobacter sp.]|nr:hypothetical protein [Prosthecobacter sp.]
MPPSKAAAAFCLRPRAHLSPSTRGGARFMGTNGGSMPSGVKGEQ